MAKRRAALVESDNEDRQEGSSTGSGPKRARFDNYGPDVYEYPPEPTHTQTKKPKTNGRRRAKVNEADEDMVLDLGVDDVHKIQAEVDEQDKQESQEQEEFDQEHEESIRESIRQRQKLTGGVAKFGIIEAIEMHQFMCHKYLTFKFGPQINFIIGHNGSGKSAVLSAITVALGGKATSTGREEAYKHEQYGDSIIITRRFTKDGASSYKIKGRDGKLVSTKREELAAICDHMNIQVDNPMNVLTQGKLPAQFLSASQPSDKYKFFLRGTQLSQLSEEYATCMENISQTHQILQRKAEALPDLQTAFKEASARFEEASKAREQRHKVDELKKELAWSHVAAKYAELEEAIHNTQKAEHRLPKCQASLDTAEADLEAATKAVKDREEEYESLGNIDHLSERQRLLKEQMRANRNKLTELKGDERGIQENLTAVKQSIRRLEDQIKIEKEKSAKHSQSKQDELNQQLEDARAAVLEAEQTLRTTEKDSKEAQSKRDDTRGRGQALDNQISQAKKECEELKTQINNLKSEQNNSLAPYGKNMQAVLEAIARTQWRGRKPVGPLGLYVKVRDQGWADLMRNVLGTVMSAFAVTDTHDAQTLRNLLKHHNNHNPQVIVSGVDLFDYRGGEPDPRYMTVLRALEISDEYVLRMLINQARIERNLLARTRAEGDELLREIGGGTCLTADLYRVNLSDSGGGSQPMQVLRRGDPRHMLFSNRNASEHLSHIQGQLSQAEARWRELEMQKETLLREYHEARQRAETLTSQARTQHRAMLMAKQTRDQLQAEANDSVLLETAGLDDTLQDMEKERESLVAQFTAVAEQKAAIDKEQQPLLQESNDIKVQIEQFDERRNQARQLVEEAGIARVRAQGHVNYWLGKRGEETQKIEDAREQQKVVQDEYNIWSGKAEEYCARVENPRKTTEVERALESLQKSLKDREKKNGASVEEMTIEVNRTQANLENTRQELKAMANLTKSLKHSIRLRLQKWSDFRRHIAFRCKVVFQYHLSNRGYFGKVLFDHVLGTLTLKVQTDDLNGTQQGSHDKDPRSLSGGEKSFATICLLLAMWESIGSPIRCLDEFDVFMDAVNRRISMKMMIDTANSSDGKQYVLITPQNMQNIHVGATVRVHRMNDPERGQGTLAYGHSVA
ncbi:P-loop containing nucleoside triphosphate hydrolase protein [Amylostereum chailletii]|nr:P-loop containing nucleoside triphosphate hydrolase protein [Amylostereum chailletii]